MFTLTSRICINSAYGFGPLCISHPLSYLDAIVGSVIRPMTEEIDFVTLKCGQTFAVPVNQAQNLTLPIDPKHTTLCPV